jgi:hypothetical protein
MKAHIFKDDSSGPIGPQINLNEQVSHGMKNNNGRVNKNHIEIDMN